MQSPDFCGWVPTVGGRLSFSIIGDPQHTDSVKTVNIADKNTRYILSHQQRDLLDSAFPVFKKSLASLIYSYDGNFEFVLLAKVPNDPANKESTLEGCICFFPRESEEWKNSWGQICECMDNLDADSESLKELSGVYKNQKEILLSIIKENSFFYSSFRLTREGIAEFYLPAANEYNNEVSGNLYLDNDDKHKACAQLFFFLKDISHVHQHHHARTDTIIDLYPYDSEGTWRQHTIRCLYRKVLRYKRTATEDSCLASLGVLSYLRAYKDILKNNGSGTDGLAGIEHLFLQDKNIEKSIAVALEKNKAKNARSSRFWGNLRTIIIGIIGLVASLIGLSSFLDPSLKINAKGSWIPTVVEYVVTNPGYIMGIVLVVSIFFLQLAGDIPWRDWEWINNTTRLVNALTKPVMGILLIGLAGALMFVAFWLFGFVP